MTQTLANTLAFTLNGKTVRLADVSPTMTLLQYLHHNGCTGTKEGCGDGDCGACTVAIAALNTEGKPYYQAINSCLVPLGAIAGADVVTVEGLAQEELHPVQAAMVKTGGSQCGYCTPGFIMSMFAAYHNGTLDDLAVEGNLCRCTGYLPIRRAAKLAAEEQQGEGNGASTNGSVDGSHNTNVNSSAHYFSDRLAQIPSTPSEWTYSSHQQQFYRPTDLSEVLALLQAHPEAMLVAGATDLGLDMSHHRQPFPTLVSLEAVTQLKFIEQTPNFVEIGATVPLSHIQTQVRGVFPSLDEMLHWFAACQVRNRATLGGNIGTASPIGDLPPVLLALDAELRIAGSNGERMLPLADFFKGYRQTDLQPGEVIVSVKIPKALAPGAVRRLAQSYKVGKRGTDDISIVAAAFTIDLDEANQIVHARLAYGGVAATPVRAIAIEQQLVGQPWNHATVQHVKPALYKVFTPLTDLRGSAEYRCMLVANLFEKFFVEMTESLEVAPL